MELSQWHRQLGAYLENPMTINLEKVVYVLNELMGVTLDEMQTSERKPQLVDARAVLVSLMLRYKLYNTGELARLLKRDPTSIARLQQRVQNSSELRQLAEEISSKLHSHSNCRDLETSSSGMVTTLVN